MYIDAQDIRPGMVVRPKGSRSGWQWVRVQRVTREPFTVKVAGQWLNGGAHTWCVSPDTPFRFLLNR